MTHSSLALLIALGLSACGGGSGSSTTTGTGTTTVTTTTPTTSGTASPSTSEINRSTGITQVNADAAYDRNQNGQSVKVAVIDTGIDVDHPDLVDRITSDSIDIVTGSTSSLNDIDGHGTHVSGIVASSANGSGTVGVAPQADILAIRADFRGTGCSGLACGFLDSDNARAVDYAVARGAKIVNLSQGKQSRLSTAYDSALDRANSADVLIVAAAGNEGTSTLVNPAARAGTSDARGRVIAVGAVSSTNRRLGFSNKASSTQEAEFMLMAPGLSINSASTTGRQRTISGTSQATAFVSGAAAVVKGAFPTLNMQQVAGILLDSAQDLGPAGTDLEYGRGLLDLDAALSPLGTLSLPAGDTVFDGGSELSSNTVNLPASFGDASSALRNISLLATDAYDRPYSVSLDNIIEQNNASWNFNTLLERRTTSDHTPIDFTESLGFSGYVARTLEIEQPHDRYSLVQEDRGATSVTDLELLLSSKLSDQTSMTLGFGEASLSRDHASAGATAMFLNAADLFDPTQSFGSDWLSLSGEHEVVSNLSIGAHYLQAIADDGSNPSNLADNVSGFTGYQGAFATFRGGSTSTTLSFGMMTEDGSAMNETGSGAFATDTTQSRVLSISHAHDLQHGVSLVAQTSWMDHKIEQSHNSSTLSDVSSHGWAIAVTKTGVVDHRDTVGLMVGQPMRSTGRMELALPRFSTDSGDIINQNTDVSLRPSGRQMDVQLAYNRKISKDANVSTYVLARSQAGHDSSQGIDSGFGVRFAQKF